MSSKPSHMICPSSTRRYEEFSTQEKYVYLCDLLLRMPNGYSAHAEFNFPKKYYTPAIAKAMYKHACTCYDIDVPTIIEQKLDWHHHQELYPHLAASVGLKRLFHYLIATGVLDFEKHLPTREIQLLYVYECRMEEAEVLQSATSVRKYLGKRRYEALLRDDDASDF